MRERVLYKATPGRLGEKLFLEPNTVTPVLKKLETMDLVRRERDPADERQVRVRPASAGRRLLERIEKETARLLIGATGLGDKDFATVRKAVAGLRDNLLRSRLGE